LADSSIKGTLTPYGKKQPVINVKICSAITFFLI